MDHTPSHKNLGDRLGSQDTDDQPDSPVVRLAADFFGGSYRHESQKVITPKRGDQATLTVGHAKVVQNRSGLDVPNSPNGRAYPSSMSSSPEPAHTQPFRHQGGLKGLSGQEPSRPITASTLKQSIAIMPQSIPHQVHHISNAGGMSSSYATSIPDSTPLPSPRSPSVFFSPREQLLRQQARPSAYASTTAPPGMRVEGTTYQIPLSTPQSPASSTSSTPHPSSQQRIMGHYLPSQAGQLQHRTGSPSSRTSFASLQHSEATVIDPCITDEDSEVFSTLATVGGGTPPTSAYRNTLTPAPELPAVAIAAPVGEINTPSVGILLGELSPRTPSCTSERIPLPRTIEDAAASSLPYPNQSTPSSILTAMPDVPRQADTIQHLSSRVPDTRHSNQAHNCGAATTIGLGSDQYLFPSCNMHPSLAATTSIYDGPWYDASIQPQSYPSASNVAGPRKVQHASVRPAYQALPQPVSCNPQGLSGARAVDAHPVLHHSLAETSSTQPSQPANFTQHVLHTHAGNNQRRTGRNLMPFQNAGRGASPAGNVPNNPVTESCMHSHHGSSVTSNVPIMAAAGLAAAGGCDQMDTSFDHDECMEDVMEGGGCGEPIMQGGMFEEAVLQGGMCEEAVIHGRRCEEAVLQGGRSGKAVVQGCKHEDPAATSAASTRPVRLVPKGWSSCLMDASTTTSECDEEDDNSVTGPEDCAGVFECLQKAVAVPLMGTSPHPDQHAQGWQHPQMATFGGTSTSLAEGQVLMSRWRVAPKPSTSVKSTAAQEVQQPIVASLRNATYDMDSVQPPPLVHSFEVTPHPPHHLFWPSDVATEHGPARNAAQQNRSGDDAATTMFPTQSAGTLGRSQKTGPVTGRVVAIMQGPITQDVFPARHSSPQVMGVLDRLASQPAAAQHAPSHTKEASNEVGYGLNQQGVQATADTGMPRSPLGVPSSSLPLSSDLGSGSTVRHPTWTKPGEEGRQALYDTMTQHGMQWVQSAAPGMNFAQQTDTVSGPPHQAAPSMTVTHERGGMPGPPHSTIPSSMNNTLQSGGMPGPPHSAIPSSMNIALQSGGMPGPPHSAIASSMNIALQSGGMPGPPHSAIPSSMNIALQSGGMSGPSHSTLPSMNTTSQASTVTGPPPRPPTWDENPGAPGGSNASTPQRPHQPGMQYGYSQSGPPPYDMYGYRAVPGAASVSRNNFVQHQRQPAVHSSAGLPTDNFFFPAQPAITPQPDRYPQAFETHAVQPNGLGTYTAGYTTPQRTESSIQAGVYHNTLYSPVQNSAAQIWHPAAAATWLPAGHNTAGSSLPSVMSPAGGGVITPGCVSSAHYPTSIAAAGTSGVACTAHIPTPSTPQHYIPANASSAQHIPESQAASGTRDVVRAATSTTPSTLQQPYFPANASNTQLTPPPRQCHVGMQQPLQECRGVGSQPVAGLYAGEQTPQFDLSRPSHLYQPPWTQSGLLNHTGWPSHATSHHGQPAAFEGHPQPVWSVRQPPPTPSMQPAVHSIWDYSIQDRVQSAASGTSSTPHNAASLDTYSPDMPSPGPSGHFTLSTHPSLQDQAGPSRLTTRSLTAEESYLRPTTIFDELPQYLMCPTDSYRVAPSYRPSLADGVMFLGEGSSPKTVQGSAVQAVQHERGFLVVPWHVAEYIADRVNRWWGDEHVARWREGLLQQQEELYQAARPYFDNAVRQTVQVHLNGMRLMLLSPIHVTGWIVSSPLRMTRLALHTTMFGCHLVYCGALTPWYLLRGANVVIPPAFNIATRVIVLGSAVPMMAASSLLQVTQECSMQLVTAAVQGPVLLVQLLVSSPMTLVQRAARTAVSSLKVAAYVQVIALVGSVRAALRVQGFMNGWLLRICGQGSGIALLWYLTICEQVLQTVANSQLLLGAPPAGGSGADVDATNLVTVPFLSGTLVGDAALSALPSTSSDTNVRWVALVAERLMLKTCSSMAAGANTLHQLLLANNADAFCAAQSGWEQMRDACTNYCLTAIGRAAGDGHAFAGTAGTMRTSAGTQVTSTEEGLLQQAEQAVSHGGTPPLMAPLSRQQTMSPQRSMLLDWLRLSSLLETVVVQTQQQATGMTSGLVQGCNKRVVDMGVYLLTGFLQLLLMLLIVSFLGLSSLLKLSMRHLGLLPSISPQPEPYAVTVNTQQHTWAVTQGTPAPTSTTTPLPATPHQHHHAELLIQRLITLEGRQFPATQDSGAAVGVLGRAVTRMVLGTPTTAGSRLSRHILSHSLSNLASWLEPPSERHSGL